MAPKKKRAAQKEVIPSAPPEDYCYGLQMPKKMRLGDKFDKKVRPWSPEFKEYVLTWLEMRQKDSGSFGLFSSFCDFHKLPRSSGAYWCSLWTKIKGSPANGPRSARSSGDEGSNLRLLAKIVHERGALEKQLGAVKSREQALRARCLSSL